MSQIKFRAWDKRLKRMLLPAMPTIHGGIMWGEKSFDTCVENNYELMQFTGLNDKKKKEIWEGDIVRMFNCEQTHEGYKETPIGLDVVVFENGMFTLKNEEDGRRLRYSVEVVGNIYANPELLK